MHALAGDSLKSIAERSGCDAIQLSRLNGLSVNSRLKRGQSIIVPASAASAASETQQSSGTPNGQLIQFADGGSLHVDEAWWKGEEIWYRRGKVTETSSRKVKTIEPVFVAQVEHKNNAATPAPIPVSEKSSADPEFWIYLVGGAKFKVDEVKETTDGAWYQRENLVSFLDHSRIARIERERPGNTPSGWTESGWTSGNLAIDQSIRTNGSRFGVDPYLVFLVIEQESHFRTRVVSPKGARGLMQLMPGTARRFAVKNSFDPAENIRGGTQYLKELLTMFNGRVDLALASYNAGEGRVISYGNKVPPFQETQNYVKRIGQRYKKGGAQREQRKGAAARSAQPALAEDTP